jgi:hypothetical protein
MDARITHVGRREIQKDVTMNHQGIENLANVNLRSENISNGYWKIWMKE